MNNNVRILVKHADKDVRQRFKTIYQLRPMINPLKINELSKNDLEIWAINFSAKVYQALLKTCAIKLDFKFDSSHVHVIDESDFSKKFGADNAAAHSCGHVYLIRSGDNWEFVHRLTHELAHIISFQEFIILPLNDLIFFDASNCRGGLEIIRKKERLFSGLNEAITEIIAHEVRKIVVDYHDALELNYLSTEDKRNLLKFYSYYEHVTIIRQLIKFGKYDVVGQEKMFQRVLSDYVFGTYNFFKDLSLNSGQVKILQKMDTSVLAASETAKILFS